MLCGSRNAKPRYREWMVEKSNGAIPEAEVLL